MPGTDLFPDESEFTPRPAWQVIEAARRQYLTGELTLHTAQTTRIYLRDGMVYFAERSTDGTLAIRLMMEGVITREQMQRGTVIVNGVEHVGRLFEADPTIDRPSVELCVELFTDDVMVDVANRIINGYELALYRRHSSGIDRWYPHAIPVVGRPNETVTERVHTREPDLVVDVKPTAEPDEPTLFQTSVEVLDEPLAEVVDEPVAESPEGPKNKLDAPPITRAVPITQSVPVTQPATVTQSVPVTQPATVPQSVPVTQPATVTRPGAITTAPPSAATQQLPITPWDTNQIPVVVSSASPAPPSAAPPMPPSTEFDATSIADEVAEAIKRAFAGLGA